MKLQHTVATHEYEKCVETIQQILSPYFTEYGTIFFKIYPETLDIILFPGHVEMETATRVPIFMKPILKYLTVNTYIQFYSSGRRPTRPGETITCLNVENIPKNFVETLETVIPCILGNQQKKKQQLQKKKQQLQKMITLSSQIITLLAKKIGITGTMDPVNPIIRVGPIDSMHKFTEFLNKEQITYQTNHNRLNITNHQNLQKLRQSLQKLSDIQPTSL